jgi:hypothetical protein
LELGSEEIGSKKAWRLTVEFLASDSQADGISALMGSLLCGASPDHDGPCRIAWRMGLLSEDDAEEDMVDPWSRSHVDFVYEQLTPIEVIPDVEVDSWLGVVDVQHCDSTDE